VSFWSVAAARGCRHGPAELDERRGGPVLLADYQPIGGKSLIRGKPGL